ncbi:PREDICTED: elongation factor 1-beta'-like [Nicrophorus vespilloides]|uniref:Elongation factor 1-beta'-like n=1 Tax=Nicrophorus vespilloides TaxID=110193 RepID=A0ABM1N7J3_NICVS|nr:PREDICTED: elongation factor 1-beta'-like [Nicrophorus vespilloides]
MTFGDVKTAEGLKHLNLFLEDKSYLSGFVPCQFDVEIFEAIPKVNANLVNVLRWHNHIKSFSAEEKKNFPPDTNPIRAGRVVIDDSDDDDEDVDLFASDDEEEDATAAKIREDRVKAYSEKKQKKPALIAKSSIVLDVKPWDDETDMKEMEKNVRTIVMDGLVFGASKLVPVGYGINKLQVMCVVEDEKCSVDALIEEIEKFEDFVQSVDIAAFNKI